MDELTTCSALGPVLAVVFVHLPQTLHRGHAAQLPLILESVSSCAGPPYDEIARVYIQVPTDVDCWPCMHARCCARHTITLHAMQHAAVKNTLFDTVTKVLSCSTCHSTLPMSQNYLSAGLNTTISKKEVLVSRASLQDGTEQCQLLCHLSVTIPIVLDAQSQGVRFILPWYRYVNNWRCCSSVAGGVCHGGGRDYGIAH
jgi:hypothetical protein